MAKNEYKVLQGIDYPPNKRAEIGDIVTDLPKESIAWLLVSGAIESVSDSKKNTDSVITKSSVKSEEVEETSDAV